MIQDCREYLEPPGMKFSGPKPFWRYFWRLHSLIYASALTKVIIREQVDLDLIVFCFLSKIQERSTAYELNIEKLKM